MGGERLESVEVEARGLVGDRLWAVREDTSSTITSGKRHPALMRCSARFARPPRGGSTPPDVPPVVITLPDDTEVSSDDPAVHARLSEVAGTKVTLCALKDASDGEHYRAPKLTERQFREAFAVGPDEPLPDFSMIPLSKLAELARYATPRGTYYDAFTLHVMTTSSLELMSQRAPGPVFDVRRFRPNIVVAVAGGEGLVENEWCGGELRAGSVRIGVQVPTVRCSMPTRAQRDLPADVSVMKALNAHSDRCLGVYADVVRPGHVRVGDDVELERSTPSLLSKFAHAGATGLKRLMLKAAAAGMPKG
jgi:hypothetical protein